MILYFDSLITDIPFNKTFVDPNRWIRNACPTYAMPSKVDIAKYTLASYAQYPWSHVLIRFTLADTSRMEEFKSYAQSLFPTATIIQGNSTNQTEYRKSLAILNEWDDDWIWYSPNNDHPITTYDLSIIDTVLAKAQSYEDQYDYISVMYSHFSEFINMPRVGSRFWKLFGRDTTIIDETEDTLTYLQARGDNTGIQIVNKKLFAFWFDAREMGDAVVYRSEDVRKFGATLNQLITVPKREIAAHFDGYSHTVKGFAEIAPDQVPPLMIPKGFFNNDIKIKYGFNVYDPDYTNVNPCAHNYSFENPRNGTDIKSTLSHLPYFWKKHISEIISNPDLIEETVKHATQKNLAISTNPYSLKHKKLTLQTLAFIFRIVRREMLPYYTAKLRKNKNGVLRRMHRILKLHPNSHPYLSGDTFRSFAHHIHDMDRDVNPLRIKKQDIVFVQSPRLAEFIKDVHPKITTPYVLITHNGDENINETYLPFIMSSTVIHWFAQNTQITHPKITPLPIGLENKWYFLHGIPSYFDRLRRHVVRKKNLILYKFTVQTNPPERTRALEVLNMHPLSTTFTDWRESFAYLNTLQDNTFVASPPGNGEDCHRTWEAMYLRTIPIVKRSALADYFVSLDLPIIVIDDWSELQKFTTHTLEELYTAMEPKFNNPALWSDFWKTKIMEQTVR
jgi:hypothetical protein